MDERQASSAVARGAQAADDKLVARRNSLSLVVVVLADRRLFLPVRLWASPADGTREALPDDAFEVAEGCSSVVQPSLQISHAVPPAVMKGISREVIFVGAS